MKMCFKGMVRISVAKCLVVASMLAGPFPAAAQTTATEADEGPTKLFPRVHETGGVYPIEGSAAHPSGRDYRLVFDVTKPGPSDQPHSSFEHAARALNLYALAGVPNDEVSIALVIHGDATPIVLQDQTYRRAFGTPNPNSRVMALLNDMGVKIEVCGQALHSAGFTPEQVSPAATTVLAAITALVERQRDGFALIP